MANSEHKRIVSQGVNAINTWREQNPGTNFDLAAARIGAIQIPFAPLADTDLSDADLGGITLTGADLSRANLIGANLRGANLTGAKLHQADLSGANLLGAILDKTDFSNATCAWTSFGNIDLSTAIGLRLIKHNAPSSLGLDSIYRSKVQLPQEFLHGCGVPFGFAKALRELIRKADPTSFHSCFISYSAVDEDFVRRLWARMVQEGLRVWFAPESMMGGRKIDTEIRKAISHYDKILLVLSAASIESDWVRNELLDALTLEANENVEKLFPIRLVDLETIKKWRLIHSSGKNLSEQVLQYHILDFVGCDDDETFNKAFERLLASLQTDPKRRKSAGGRKCT